MSRHGHVFDRFGGGVTRNHFLVYSYERLYSDIFVRAEFAYGGSFFQAVLSLVLSPFFFGPKKGVFFLNFLGWVGVGVGGCFSFSVIFVARSDRGRVYRRFFWCHFFDRLGVGSVLGCFFFSAAFVARAQGL